MIFVTSMQAVLLETNSVLLEIFRSKVKIVYFFVERNLMSNFAFGGKMTNIMNDPNQNHHYYHQNIINNHDDDQVSKRNKGKWSRVMKSWNGEPKEKWTRVIIIIRIIIIN